MTAMEYFAFVLLFSLCGPIFVEGAVPSWTTPGSGDATVSVDEAASGASVATLAATDSDSGTVTYSLISQTPSTTTYFDVASDGAVTTSAETDYETMTDKVFTLLVLATSDNAATDTATGTLTVSITDANDNAPTYSATSAYTACISSSSSSGTTVTTITASDADGTTANNEINSYSIASGDTLSQFDISNAGVVTRTAVALDTTVSDIYVLQIKAIDTGSSPLTGTTTLIVYLDDDNKCNNGAAALTGSLIVSFLITLVYKMF